MAIHTTLSSIIINLRLITLPLRIIKIKFEHETEKAEMQDYHREFPLILYEKGLILLKLLLLFSHVDHAKSSLLLLFHFLFNPNVYKVSTNGGREERQRMYHLVLPLSLYIYATNFNFEIFTKCLRVISFYTKYPLTF